ncbi:phytanoyl-CoA dioxygenase family protein [Bythopirellula polymerisocia]|uniref:Phytanoyl-CoA dioxygenase (PhyH) n=1 Tax=Bythopirellula polymerisocia TaxID=2528003 RepID=A0A5C6CDI8_9BACT|nr:phytanoyl-CoA dioxygenase family protein [Bythopirellula polymerisocia]TWU20869.1 hypothetical protein Pla144_47690 [Bythopirellula polymerisocia]
MTTLYFDSKHPEPRRRANIFKGDIYVFSPRPSTRKLIDFAHQLAVEAFAPHDPCEAQHHMPPEKFAEILGKLKPQFMHDPNVKDFMRDMLEDFGADSQKTYFDVPRMRTMTHGDYLRTGIALAVPPHRDTWFAGHQSQLNWWFPMKGVQPDNTMILHPGYFNRGVENISNRYNHNDWLANARGEAVQHVKKDTRNLPEITQEIDHSSDIVIQCEEGGLILFSASHLHSTSPNTSGHSRFSVDFRTVNLDDVVSGNGAPNVDNRAVGTTLGEYMQVADLSPIPEEVVVAQ